MTSTLPPPPEGWHLLGYKALNGSRLAFVGANADIHGVREKTQMQRNLHDSRRLAAQATGRVWLFQDDQLIEGVQFPLLEPFPIIDQFPDGSWLVVNARSDGRGNARILGADGFEIRRIELGDGINHVKIDDERHIWVGWFDEGIFGNDNWRLQGLRAPPSAYGIAAFDEFGELLMHATREPIADCYALNAFRDEAWACTYTDFPIWRIRGGAECFWPTGLRGTSAIAVKYPYVLAAGGYQDEADRVLLFRLEEAEAHSEGEWRLPFDAGRLRMIDGRGDTLHVVQEQQWHRWRVTDFLMTSGD